MADAVAAVPGDVFPMQAAAGDAAIDYTAVDFRRFVSTVFVVGGVGGGTHLRMSQRAEGANWSFDVAPGDAIVNGPGGQKYHVHLATKLNVDVAGSINTAPTSTLVHNVYLVVDDKNYAGTTYGARVIVRENTGAGTFSPTGVAGYLILGSISIGPGQVSLLDAHITDRRVDLRGGTRYAAGTKTCAINDAGTGQVGSPTKGSYHVGPYRVDFPAGRFARRPIVQLTQSSLPGGSYGYMPKATNISATGFDLYIYDWQQTVPNPNGGSVDVDWYAVAAE